MKKRQPDYLMSCRYEVGITKVHENAIMYGVGSVKESLDMYTAFRQLIQPEEMEFREVFCILFFNRAMEIIGCATPFTGGSIGCVVEAKTVFTYALAANANAIAVCHNHPSGRTNPSPQDIEITKTLKEAGLILGIRLVDHLIITSKEYYSFMDSGKL